MRCLLCGKETDKTIEGLCLDCYIKKNPPLIKISPIVVCKYCGKVKVGKVWKKIDIKKLVKVKPPYKLESIEDGIVLSLEGELFKFDYNVPINYGICPQCARQQSEYYETILQLRGENAIKEALKIIGQRQYRISKYEEKEEGLDLYMVSYREAEKLVKELKQKINGIIKKTFKLHTRDKQTSKDIYRSTILFREVKLKEGQTLIHNGKKYKVLKVSDDYVIVRHGNEIARIPLKKLI